MTDQPKRYSIEKLLQTGVQPFPDWPDEELDQFGKDLGRKMLAQRVSMTSDGIIVDGHQRLQALQRAGHKTISADEVHIVEWATKANALELAVELNVRKRPSLTIAEKANMARQLQRKYNWSQRKLAKIFGVSQPAISQWLSATPTDDTDPVSFVIGEDGKEYSPTREKVERAPRHPWAPDGHAYRAIHKATRALQSNETIAGLNPIHLAKLAQELDDLIEAAEEVRNQVQDES